MLPISNDRLMAALSSMGVGDDITSATIRQVVALSSQLERESGEQFLHLELGNPGLPATEIGVGEEVRRLREGIANTYPNITGIPEIKQAGSEFVKAFVGLDIPGRYIIPTVGSMQGTFAMFLLLAHRAPERDTVVYIHPGFHPQLMQSKVLGLRHETLDIYDCRGPRLEERLEEYLSKGNVTAILYSNPNNPAWTNFTEEELEIIGRLATRYDVVVMEDMAYLGMDFRSDYSRPGQPPYIPTVGRYTDNYVIFISGSKIFSYAGQRIAIACIGPRLGDRSFPDMSRFFGIPAFVDCFTFGVLYCISSGTAHSAQFAMAAMLGAAARGELDFVSECREYGRRAEQAKRIFAENGFHIVYERDADDRPISDGFFFTVGYGHMDSRELQAGLLRHGIATIALSSTGSRQEGVRICVSALSDGSHFEELRRRLRAFAREYPLEK